MPMMKVPEAKAAGYTAVTIACAILLMLVVAPITAAITGLVGFGAASMSSSSDAGGTVTLPGGKEMDLGKVEEMTKQMEKAADELMRAYMGSGKIIFEGEDPEYYALIQSHIE